MQAIYSKVFWRPTESWSAAVGCV